MKTAAERNRRKGPIVRIGPSLEQDRNKGLFPAKPARANEMLKTATLPAKRWRE